MLRRTKREVEKELPSKIEHVVKCAMSAWQKILYQQITDKVCTCSWFLHQTAITHQPTLSVLLTCTALLYRLCIAAYSATSRCQQKLHLHQCLPYSSPCFAMLCSEHYAGTPCCPAVWCACCCSLLPTVSLVQPSCCLCKGCSSWEARYNTWLLIKLTPKGVVFSFLFFSFLFFSFLFKGCSRVCQCCPCTAEIP